MSRIALLGATLVLLSSCSSSVEPTSQPRLMAVSATRLAGTVGAIVTPAPTVLVTDDAGTPLQGVFVTAEITGGGGTVGSKLLKTDRDGRASASWALGGKAGLQLLTLRAGLESALEFTAVAAAGEVASISVLGVSQAADPGATLPEPLIASVRDRFGNPVAGAAVTFSVLSGGGSIDEAPRITDSAGIARSGRWTLGPDVGLQRARVRSGPLETIATARTFGCWEAIPGSCSPPLELVFTRPSDHQIYRVRSDGSGLTRLTTTGDNRAPVWSPDGRRIAFIHSDRDDEDIWIMNADGSNVVRLLQNSSYTSIAWSPDGKRLALSRWGYGDPRVVIIDVDPPGASEKFIALALSAAWSPDGQRIAFVEPDEYDGNDALAVMNADGTNRRLLTPHDGPIGSRIAWSPDGLEVLYTTAGTIYAARVDRSGVRVIQRNGFIEGVQVSPDGRWLGVTFTGPAPGTPILSSLPIDGGAVTFLLNDASDAAWRP